MTLAAWCPSCRQWRAVVRARVGRGPVLTVAAHRVRPTDAEDCAGSGRKLADGEETEEVGMGRHRQPKVGLWQRIWRRRRDG